MVSTNGSEQCMAVSIIIYNQMKTTTSDWTVEKTCKMVYCGVIGL